MKNKTPMLKLSLTNKDIMLLNRYALLNDMTMKMAAKKIIREFLTANVTMPEQTSKNQLDLFSSRETDLFDYTN